MNHNKTPIFDALKDYRSRGVTPFDVPGHKHGRGLSEFTDYMGETMMQVDVNSMKCLDNLSNPTSVIKEAETLMADAYGADYSFFMVSGTSSSVQAMIMSVCRPGDKLILPRNAHKSATNGLILSGANPVYIQPEINAEIGIAMGVSFETVKKTIDENEDAKGIFIVNPTYYGVSSDLEKIIAYAHEKRIAVLVDEAHGAHFNFHKDLPQSAAHLGADLVAVSIHKTGGSLTQSSVLLLNEGLIDRKYVRTIINVSQTTSASYLLMSSLDVARKNLVINGQEILSNVLALVRDARARINNIDGFYAFGKELINGKGVYKFDETKLSINVYGLGMTGFEVYNILRDKYNIQMELGDLKNVLAIISLGDTSIQMEKLISALEEISKDSFKEEEKHIADLSVVSGESVMLPRDAFYYPKKNVRISDAAGEISGEAIMVYPPGIPLLAPGELITEELIQRIEYLKTQNTLLTDLEDTNFEYIKVVNRLEVVSNNKKLG